MTDTPKDRKDIADALERMEHKLAEARSKALEEAAKAAAGVSQHCYTHNAAAGVKMCVDAIRALKIDAPQGEEKP